MRLLSLLKATLLPQRILISLIILSSSGCSTYQLIEDISEPYYTDLKQINLLETKLIPKEIALDTVTALTTTSWAEKPWVYVLDRSGRVWGNSKKSHLNYQNMLIVIPTIEYIKERELENMGRSEEYYRLRVLLPGYEFIQEYYFTKSEEIKNITLKEIKDKLTNCVYITGKGGEIKTHYYGIKELCTGTPYDRLKLMKGLIALGASTPF